MDNENMDINQVEINSEGANILFDVIADGPCGNKCVICLSSKNSTDPACRIEGSCQWFDFSGTLSVDKSKVTGNTDLYLYLLDTQTQITCTPVQVYAEAANLLSVQITDDGAFVLKVDRNKNTWQLSSDIILEYTNSYGQYSFQEINLPSMRIPMEELDLWIDHKTFSFGIRFHMVSHYADIYSAPSDTATVYIAAPEARGVCLNKNILTFTGTFLSGAIIEAELTENGTSCRAGELTPDYKLDLAGQKWDPGAVYRVALSYKGAVNRSLQCTPFTLLTEAPVADSCMFDGKNAIIRLQKQAVYQAVYGEITKCAEGNTVSVPFSTDSVRLSMIRGKVSGPEISCPVEAPAFYHVTCGDNTFYYWGKRPDDLDTGQDITVALTGIFAAMSSYDGSYFKFVKKTEQMAELIIKKEFYRAEMDVARQDYQALYQKLSPMEDGWKTVKAALLEHLPMDVESFPYYFYDYAPDDGYTGIFPGMSLLTEYAVYQNIPDSRDKESFMKDLSGFAGSGAVRYSVISRNGKITLDAFCSEMNFRVPPPAVMSSDNKLCGGAGIADLLYDGFSAAHMRLLYPLAFPDRNSPGTLIYADNVCLITAEKIYTLMQAAEAMRRRGLHVEGAAYQHFRGRSIVIPQILVHVNKKDRWVSLGTILGDILLEENAAKVSLYRRRNGVLYPFSDPKAQMPLLMGDSIEVN